MKKRRSLISPGTWTLVVLVLAILAWEWGASAGTVDVFFFGSPSLVWAEFMEMVERGSMARHLSATLQEAGLGLGISPKLSTALMPLMTGLNGLPKLALGPLVIIWFGIGLKSKVVIAVLMVFFVFAFNLYSGVNSVERELVTAVKLLGGTQKQILKKVIWPASIPWLLASLRTGLGLSISGAIVGEYLGAGQGMGWVISNAGERYDVNQVLCCVAVLVILVMLLDGVVRLLEGKLLRWR